MFLVIEVLFLLLVNRIDSPTLQLITDVRNLCFGCKDSLESNEILAPISQYQYLITVAAVLMSDMHQNVAKLRRHTIPVRSSAQQFFYG